MSGHKRTTVSLGDMTFERIQSLEDRLMTVEKDYDRILKRVRANQATELNEIYSKFHQDEQVFQQNVFHTISDQSLSIENNLFEVQNILNTTLDGQAELFHQQLCNLESGMVENTSEMISNFGNQIIRAIDVYISERDSEIENLRQEFLSKGETKQAISIEAVQSANDLFDYVTNNYPVDRYCPIEIKDIYDEIVQSKKNIEEGFFDAGLMSAQNSFRDLEKIRMFVKEKELTRQYHLALVRKAFHELREIAGSYQTINAIGLDQEDLGIDIDVSFWSGDRYRQAVKKINSLIYKIENFGESLVEVDLRKIYDENLPLLKDELLQSIYWARRNVLASQIRYNIATWVVHALGEQGFVLTSGSYAESDQRCFYQVHLRHIDGSEVIVEVKEIENEMSASQLELESLDADIRSEHELRQRAYEVARSLRQYGLQVGKNFKREEDLSYLLPQSDPDIQKNSSNHSIMEQKVDYGRN
jgi:hypothetical protein